MKNKNSSKGRNGVDPVPRVPTVPPHLPDWVFEQVQAGDSYETPGIDPDSGQNWPFEKSEGEA